MDPYSAIFMRQVDLPIYYKHVKAYEATVTIYLFIFFFWHAEASYIWWIRFEWGSKTQAFNDN